LAWDAAIYPLGYLRVRIPNIEKCKTLLYKALATWNRRSFVEQLLGCSTEFSIGYLFASPTLCVLCCGQNARSLSLFCHPDFFPDFYLGADPRMALVENLDRIFRADSHYSLPTIAVATKPFVGALTSLVQ